MSPPPVKAEPDEAHKQSAAAKVRRLFVCPPSHRIPRISARPAHSRTPVTAKLTRHHVDPPSTCSPIQGAAKGTKMPKGKNKAKQPNAASKVR